MRELAQIKIILIEPSHSGNIGSAARAMKTMGITQLRLVAPKQGIDEQAIALAAGAQDVLAAAEQFASFDEAVADCQWVIGTSARLRHLQASLIAPRDVGELAIDKAEAGQSIAIVFGRERVGLSNDELLKCHYHLHFPTNPEYGSLNLAMAVQLVCYEIYQQFVLRGGLTPSTEQASEYPTQAAMNHFYQHLERLLRSVDFIKNDALMAKIRRFYQRARPESSELAVLRGIVSTLEKALAEQANPNAQLTTKNASEKTE